MKGLGLIMFGGMLILFAAYSAGLSAGPALGLVCGVDAIALGMFIGGRKP